MRDKVVFAAEAAGASIVLFALVWWLGATGFPVNPQLVGYAVPAVAVMLAARGVPWRRKVMFAAGTLGGLVLIDAVAGWTGLTALTTLEDDFAGAPVASLLGIVYSIVPIIYALASLMLFVGRRPSDLWTKRER